MSTIDIVTGAQYGSEGKGHVTAQLVKRRSSGLLHPNKITNIRVAGPNAGHTVIDDNGVAYPLRTIPVAAAIDPTADLYIAPGSEIDLEVLVAEVNLLRENGHELRNLYVSGEATLLEKKHQKTETKMRMHENIGSTGKGIGAARADRIMRTAKRVIDDWEARTTIFALKGQILSHDEELLYMANQLKQDHRAIIIEGTQGYGLGLHAGRYPQCTSNDARAIDFLAMAGISPWAEGVEQVTPWLVSRVYPIRVAGNSGPLEGETTWEELGLPAEKTTVTHKTRRVGHWDQKLIREAVIGNGSNVKIALTMVDQKIPSVSYSTSLGEIMGQARIQLTELVRQVEQDAGAPVDLVTTGPNHAVWLDM